MTKTKNQRMVTFSIILAVVGGIIVVASLALYRHYSGKVNTEREQKATEQRDNISKNISSSKEELSDKISKGDSMIVEKVESGKKEILEQQSQSSGKASTERQESAEKIIDKIDETSIVQVGKQDEILDKLEEFTSHSYKPLNNATKQQIIENLKYLKSNTETIPGMSIEIETGNSQRHKVALELESMLTPLGLGSYGKGNTFMGRFPDHPISLFCNTENLPYAKKLQGILSAYIKEGIVIRPDTKFSKSFLRLYINGNPEFYNDGTIKIN